MCFHPCKLGALQRWASVLSSLGHCCILDKLCSILYINERMEFVMYLLHACML